MLGNGRFLAVLIIATLLICLLPASLAHAASYSKNLTETLTLSDSVQVRKYSPLQESLSLTDSLSTSEFTPRSESLSLSDSLQVALYRFNTSDVLESLPIGESVSVEKFTPGSESLPLSDTLSVTVYRYYSEDVTDSLYLSDDLQINRKTLMDSISLSEAVRVGIYRPSEESAGRDAGQYLYLWPWLDTGNKLVKTVTLKSIDGTLQLMVIEGTIPESRGDVPLNYISMLGMSLPAQSLPEGVYIISAIYELGPSGASFDTPVILTFTYNPNRLPEGMSDQDLRIAYWDGRQGKWIPLDSIIDAANHTVTTAVTHFTMFAILGFEPGPPVFEISELSVMPQSVETREGVTINALVTNTGGREGTYNVVLMINGEKEAEESVTVAGGDTQIVTFSLVKEAMGSYFVVVDGLSSSFKVIAPAELPQSPEMSLTLEESVSVQVISPTPPAPWFNVVILYGCIAVFIIVGLIVFFLVKRRAGKY